MRWQFWFILSWYLRGTRIRYARRRRVWSRIQLLCSQLRDVLMGRLEVLIVRESLASGCNESQRLIAFYQQGLVPRARVGSFNRVKVCFGEAQCQSFCCRNQFPNVLVRRKFDPAADSDPSLTAIGSHCARDALWTLRLLASKYLSLHGTTRVSVTMKRAVSSGEERRRVLIPFHCAELRVNCAVNKLS